MDTWDTAEKLDPIWGWFLLIFILAIACLFWYLTERASRPKPRVSSCPECGSKKLTAYRRIGESDGGMGIDERRIAYDVTRCKDCGWER